MLEKQAVYFETLEGGAGGFMRKILEGLYTWSVFNEEKKLPFNGLYLKTDFTAVLIDPPPLSEADQAEIERLHRPEAILLTNKHHTRAAASGRDKWAAKIFIHKSDLPLMEIPADATFSDGEELASTLKVVRVPDAKTPGESAFYWAAQKTMIVGDAVIGKPAGAVSMLPDEKFKDPRRAREGLRALLDYDFERLLVGDGVSIEKNAKKILEDFLKNKDE